MADDVAPSAEQQEEPKAKPGRRKNMIMAGVLVGVMAIEAVVVIVLVKSFTPAPASAAAGEVAGIVTDEGAKQVEEVEIQVASFRAQNEKSQRLLIYDLVVWATVEEGEPAARFAALLERKKTTIQDRFSGIIRAAEPQTFMEPDLATLRQQFMKVLSELAGDELTIGKVLIPSVVSYSES
jgi:hypothetical protein